MFLIVTEVLPIDLVIDTTLSCYLVTSLSSSVNYVHNTQVMISTRVEDPGLALLALAESEGNVSLASRRAADGRYDRYLQWVFAC